MICFACHTASINRHLVWASPAPHDGHGAACRLDLHAGDLHDVLCCAMLRLALLSCVVRRGAVRWWLLRLRLCHLHGAAHGAARAWQRARGGGGRRRQALAAPLRPVPGGAPLVSGPVEAGGRGLAGGATCECHAWRHASALTGSAWEQQQTACRAHMVVRPAIACRPRGLSWCESQLGP